MPDAPGLIPAGAGKTRRLERLYVHPGAHPRRCGENGTVEERHTGDEGSSPQVRGKLDLTNFQPFLVGLIPAGAGKTTASSEQRKQRRAHPRRCGENTGTLDPSSSQFGSSPQVRGKRRAIRTVYYVCGLIPAGAGKTLYTQGQEGIQGAHPRRCGENCGFASLLRFSQGSSPQVRGKRSLRRCV